MHGTRLIGPRKHALIKKINAILQALGTKGILGRRYLTDRYGNVVGLKTKELTGVISDLHDIARGSGFRISYRHDIVRRPEGLERKVFASLARAS